MKIVWFAVIDKVNYGPLTYEPDNEADPSNFADGKEAAEFIACRRYNPEYWLQFFGPHADSDQSVTIDIVEPPEFKGSYAMTMHLEMTVSAEAAKVEETEQE
jgi:hypothetical protein